MSDLSFGSNATARASAIGIVTPRAAAARRHGPVSVQGPYAAFFHITIALLFLVASINWPGAILLTVILLAAAHAAVNATMGFQTALSDGDRDAQSWLSLVGAAALTVGILSLTLLDGAAAIVPVLVGAWCAARARTIWLFAAGAASLALGLLLLTAFGAQNADPLCFIAVQAASSGATMLALSLSAPSNGLIERRWKQRRS